MKKINLKESLIKLDMDTDFKHSLTDLYEACRLDENKKEKLAQYIEDRDIPGMSKMLSNEANVMTENISDDMSDEEVTELLGEGREWFSNGVSYYDDDLLTDTIDMTMNSGKLLNARWVDNHEVIHVGYGKYEVKHKVNGTRVKVEFDTSDKTDPTLRFKLDGKDFIAKDHYDAQNIIIGELEKKNLKQFDVVVDNLSTDTDEEVLNEGPGAVLGDLAGKAVGDAWKGVKNFAKGVKDTAKDVAKTTKAVAKSAHNDWKQSKTRAKVVDAARAVKDSENVDDFKAKYQQRQDDRKLSDKARTQSYKGKLGKAIGDMQDWKFEVNGKKMSYDQFMKLPQENREHMIKNKTVKCYDLMGKPITVQDQAKRLSGLKLEKLLLLEYSEYRQILTECVYTSKASRVLMESVGNKKTFSQWFDETSSDSREEFYPFSNYVKTFPNAEVLANATAEDIKNNAHKFYDVYAVDSADREQAFHFASEELDMDYDDFYYAWINEKPIVTEALKESVDEISQEDALKFLNTLTDDKLGKTFYQYNSKDRDHLSYIISDEDLLDLGYNGIELKEEFSPNESGIQSVKVYNPYNYTIQELRIDNDAKTFERGNFTMGKPDKKFKNRQQYEDLVDQLKELGYTEISSDYQSLRNKSRKGVPTNESWLTATNYSVEVGMATLADKLQDAVEISINDGSIIPVGDIKVDYKKSESSRSYLTSCEYIITVKDTGDDFIFYRITAKTATDAESYKIECSNNNGRLTVLDTSQSFIGLIRTLHNNAYSPDEVYSSDEYHILDNIDFWSVRDLYAGDWKSWIKESFEEAFEHPQSNPPYWYLCKYGIGPGAIPKGVTVMDTMDDHENPYRCYVALDKVLTTDELKQFEMTEKKPPMKESVKKSHKPSLNEELLGESVDEEDKPFTHSQIFDELKRETANFSVGEDRGIYSFEKEVKMAEKILKKHYETVKVTERGNDFMVEFSGPKNKKKKVNESLGSRLVKFMQDYDHYEYSDSLEVGDTEEDAVKSEDRKLADKKYVKGVIDRINQIVEDDPDAKNIDPELVNDLSKLLNESKSIRNNRNLMEWFVAPDWDSSETNQLLTNAFRAVINNDTKSQLKSLARTYLGPNYSFDFSYPSWGRTGNSYDYVNVQMKVGYSSLLDIFIGWENNNIIAKARPDGMTGRTQEAATKLSRDFYKLFQDVKKAQPDLFELPSWELDESKSLTESKGRFELEVWVPGSGGDDDRERFIMASNNLQEIIDKAYEIDLDGDEAFYLRDMKDIYPYDLDQCYDAEELEDAIYNQWHYEPSADMRKQLGKMLLPKNEAIELTADEMKAKHGTDNPDIINAGKEEKDRVALKEDSWDDFHPDKKHYFNGLLFASVRHEEFNKRLNKYLDSMNMPSGKMLKDRIGKCSEDTLSKIYNWARGELLAIRTEVNTRAMSSLYQAIKNSTDTNYPGQYAIQYNGNVIEIYRSEDNRLVREISFDVRFGACYTSLKRGNGFNDLLCILNNDRNYKYFKDIDFMSMIIEDDYTTECLGSDGVRKWYRADDPHDLKLKGPDKDEFLTESTQDKCERQSINEAMTYTDTDGFLGEPGETYTMSQFRRMWQDKDNDPIMSGYDSFEEWVGETISQMDREFSSLTEANKFKNVSSEEFRTPMQVTEISHMGGSYYPICPRCDTTIDREYMSYCDRCGQSLNWKGFSKAKVRKRESLTEDVKPNLYYHSASDKRKIPVFIKEVEPGKFKWEDESGKSEDWFETEEMAHEDFVKFIQNEIPDVVIEESLTESKPINEDGFASKTFTDKEDAKKFAKDNKGAITSVVDDKLNPTHYVHYKGKKEPINETTSRGIEARRRGLFRDIRDRLGTNNLMGSMDQWTEEEKTEYEEIACINMLHSILTYSDSHSVEEVMQNEYLRKYFDTLGEERVRELALQEIEEFKDAVIDKNSMTDSEGVSYNSVRFRDDKNEAFEHPQSKGPYWYLCKHGIGPGAIPKGVNIVDTIDDEENPYRVYVALDKVLTTDELSQFEMKEAKPPINN